MKTILIFPSCLESSLTQLEDAKKWGLKVIGASSTHDDPYKNKYDDWTYLPYIHEKSFIQELKKVIANYKIDGISSTHAPSYQHLSNANKLLSEVKMINASPYEIQTDKILEMCDTVNSCRAKIEKIARKSVNINETFLLSLLFHALPLYGESSLDKIIAFCAICSDAPRGDIIEIGSFFGKSAYTLNRLGLYFNIGNCLAIDPWDMELSIQKEATLGIQDLSKKWDWDIVFKGFLMTTQANCLGTFNYLRMSSKKAFQYFSKNKTISSLEFNKTTYSGKISVLHIDGNHDESNVKEDTELWGQFVIPGGWIVFDDYTWSQGDGPRIVVDDLKLKWKDKIEKFFVSGGAAFIKLKDSL